jgi:hypothetical protein
MSCTKCGSAERPATRYVRAGPTRNPREWLEHTCTDCGYRWTEPTRDATAA